MSSTTTPQSSSGYASPANSPSPNGLPTTFHSKPSTKPKPANVFSNDGSFLERFQHLKRVSILVSLLCGCFTANRMRKRKRSRKKRWPGECRVVMLRSLTHAIISSRKRAFDDRFVCVTLTPASPVTYHPQQKARGKRPLPAAESSDTATDSPTKKSKIDEPVSGYQPLDMPRSPADSRSSIQEGS